MTIRCIIFYQFLLSCFRGGIVLIDKHLELFYVIGLEVHSLLSKRDPASEKRIRLLGQVVCAASFRKIMGVGSTRFRKLQQAARSGEDAPVDGRYFSRAKLFHAKSSRKRQLILEFLQELNVTLAEPMPTAARDMRSANVVLPPKRPLRAKRPRAFLKKTGRAC